MSGHADSAYGSQFIDDRETEKNGPLGYLLAAAFGLLVYGSVKDGAFLVATLALGCAALSLPQAFDALCASARLRAAGRTGYRAALATLVAVCLALIGYHADEAGFIQAKPQQAASPAAQSLPRNRADEAMGDFAKYRDLSLNLMARQRRGTVGADECTRAVREADAMPWEEHQRYLHTYWKAAADLCNGYLNGSTLPD